MNLLGINILFKIGYLIYFWTIILAPIIYKTLKIMPFTTDANANNYYEILLSFNVMIAAMMTPLLPLLFISTLHFMILLGKSELNDRE